MTEGWLQDEYLVLFDEQEIKEMTERYGVARFVTGYEGLGLRGWDDFILRDKEGNLFKLPTLPLSLEYLEPFSMVIEQNKIERDERFSGKVKWYVQPLIFGGDPQSEENMQWINFEQHAGAVQWWNQKYLEVKNA